MFHIFQLIITCRDHAFRRFLTDARYSLVFKYLHADCTEAVLHTFDIRALKECNTLRLLQRYVI